MWWPGPYWCIICTKFFLPTTVTSPVLFFMVSKMALSLWAFVGLIGAWNIRKNTFVRTIIFGGFTYAGFSLLTIISVYTETVIIGLYQYELYFIGCLADILIFSSALGYRYQKVQEEKIATQHALNEELQKNKLLMDRQHALLQWESEQQKNQLQLQRKVQDEVGAGLSSIHVFADIVRQQLPEGHVASEQVQRVVKESQRLMDDMGDMIWLANLEQQQEWHQRMIARIKDYGLEMLQLSQISCEYIIDPSFYQSKLSKEFIIEKLVSSSGSISRPFHCQIVRVVFAVKVSCQVVAFYTLIPLSEIGFCLKHIQLLHCLCPYRVKLQCSDFHSAFLTSLSNASK
jgi:signal transduction histidine kinase